VWSLADCRHVFLAVGLMGVVVFSVPSAMVFVRWPGGEKFSELYVLGPGHMAEGYPFNVRENEGYMVYLGVRDDLGSSAYYVVNVKFRNQTEPLPNATAGVPSSSPPLYEYRVFLQDGQSWERPLTFSFSQVSVAQNRSVVGSLSVDGVTISVNRPEAWDDESKGYFYELFMELWVYNVSSDAFQFHNRFVGVWVNMTAAS
jgi:hypothetical protein